MHNEVVMEKRGKRGGREEDTPSMGAAQAVEGPERKLKQSIGDQVVTFKFTSASFFCHGSAAHRHTFLAIKFCQACVITRSIVIPRPGNK